MAQRPEGTETVEIRCGCSVCGDRTAYVRADSEHARKSERSQTIRHNLTALAYGPLGRAASVRASGPWSE